MKKASRPNAATTTASVAGKPPPAMSKKRTSGAPTSVNSLSTDSLSLIFSYLHLLDVGRCSLVCKYWNSAIIKTKLLQSILCKKLNAPPSHFETLSTGPGGSLSASLQELVADQHRLSLQKGSINVFQWKGHDVRIDQCRIKRGLVLTGVGDKVMRLWSPEDYNCLEEFDLPDRASLVDFDFDETKVVGLTSSRVCIWRRNGRRNIFSSNQGLFPKSLCMRFADPNAVIGCEDGTARVFDMYSKKCSQIIRMQYGPVSCISVTDDELIISGSTAGTVTLSDLSSDQEVIRLRSPAYGGIRTLCFNPNSHLLFAGSTAGYVLSWDIRTMKSLWSERVSPNVIYSMNHMRNDNSTLVVGGLDGILRILNQQTGELFSSCMMENTRRSGLATRLPPETRIDQISKTSRPTIRCLAVGREKVVTTHNDGYIRIWKFNKLS
ncbi:F-box/WD-40 repeat-containing protein At3g52030 [Impatiens glandulifera]|uniref:F-box/WD-40 repeat-containing protein At3g52030 n=1 Tax=Impatiens glandulifera TaxID=253017 RepID=UPI001FB191B8|nr:F-box/WD-40 repeat-containing protein At3g52030 [Impatiens glandulifera]